jgi:hypothetical protein
MAKAKALAVKSSSVTPQMRVPEHGRGALQVGNPGNKGGGRPPNWLKDWCDELLAKPDSKKQVEEILANKDHAAFATMWAKVAERAHGKAKESVEISGPDGGPLAMTVTFVAAK